MKIRILYLLIFVMSISVLGHSQANKKTLRFRWDELPDIPDSNGFAGSFAGVSNNCLIVAGGANFPDGGEPWTGSKKVWADKIFVLDKSNKWKQAGKLPMPLGYGVSIVWHKGLICIGGSNADGHQSIVLYITYQDDKIKISKLTNLPNTLANSTGALVGDIIYIAGGLMKPEDKQASHKFWSLDLSQPSAEQFWKELEPWPGPSRMLSVAGSQGKSFFLFSGAELVDDGHGMPKRKYLIDAYQYIPAKAWRKLKDMPYATVAAPTPAYTANLNLIIFGGDDGKLAEHASELKEKHPGFCDEILNYNITSDTWNSIGKIATNKKSDAFNNPNNSQWAPVTTTMIIWKGKLIFPGGEVRPAVRTPHVLAATPLYYPK